MAVDYTYLPLPTLKIHPHLCSVYEQDRGKLVRDLPMDIWLEILSRVPLKSLCNCRKVCKAWYCAICHRRFAKMQHDRAPLTPPSVVILPSLSDDFYLVDHQVFDNLQESATVYALQFSEFSRLYPDQGYGPVFTVLGSINGLICISPSNLFYVTDSPYCIWNPIIQEHILLPPSPNYHTHAASGFGFDSTREQYKIVRLLKGPEAEVEIHTVGSRKWRRIQNVPYTVTDLDVGVYANGSLHWLSSDLVLIVVFNLATEEFSAIQLPHSIDRGLMQFGRQLLGVYDKRLGLKCCPLSRNNIEIWLLKDYKMQECWTKEYDPTGYLWTSSIVRGLIAGVKLRNGELLVYDSLKVQLGYYEPKTDIFRAIRFQNDAMRKSVLRPLFHVGSLYSPKSIENRSL